MIIIRGCSCYYKLRSINYDKMRNSNYKMRRLLKNAAKLVTKMCKLLQNTVENKKSN